ncbi:MAG: DUF1793 domain-containing protein, partial [Alistipes shahii]|nr:DUF1793 domain-containing protein [Alistipes shahii]
HHRDKSLQIGLGKRIFHVTIDFPALIEPVYRLFNETVDRVSMTDWYNTDSRTHIHFKAHSVVGGYFMKIFDAKYNGR